MNRRRGPVHSLVWRQIRLSTAVMAALTLIMIRVGVTGFDASGGARGMISVEALLKNPAISALYGRATTLATAGAFVAWKMGMTLSLAAALWAGLMATRVTRASEDDGSWDALVVGRRGRQPALATTIAVLGESCAVLGLVCFVGLYSSSQGVLSCLLFAVGIGGVAWCGAAIGLLAGQLVAPRRSATQVALSVVGVMYLVRMLADSSQSSRWLDWFTPFGWLENLGAFQHHSATWCWALLLIPSVIAAYAWSLQARRDIGSAVWTRSDRTRAHEALLGSAWSFSWRERRSTLAVWSAGLAALGLTVGYLTNALVAFCRSDPGYVRLLNRWGFGSMISARGFIGEICVMMALALGYFVVAMLAMLASDGQRGRLDMPLSYGPSRLNWIVSALATTALATVVVVVVCGVSIWVGVELSGTPMSIWAPLAGMFNSASTATLFIGLTVLLITIITRLAYVVMAALLALCYLIAALGPTLNWPHWLLATSPLYYLKIVPVQPTNWGATWTCALIGVVAGTLAVYRFTRIDVGT